MEVKEQAEAEKLSVGWTNQEKKNQGLEPEQRS